ncbi:MAG: DUF1365 domain-containing protein [Propionibacteriales bacterium]|nr:DUF1365 domain-containing protein [Propionibacteriales bacterium]
MSDTTHLTLPAEVTLPALVKGEVRHARFHPVEHAFRYRAHQWLVDADRPEVASRWLRGLVSFQARDHLGSPDGELGDNVRAFLTAQHVSWSAHRIIMLANARTLGYVFDPLTVYWCYAADGSLEGVLAEVHNTYGERHGYIVEVDDHGVGRADKQLYVSPFFGVFGDYQLKFVHNGDKVGAFVTLKQGERVVFTGSFTGRTLPATSRRILGVALTQPLMPQRVAALIRIHGVWLWLKRLPVVRRSSHLEQKGSR